MLVLEVTKSLLSWLSDNKYEKRKHHAKSKLKVPNQFTRSMNCCFAQFQTLHHTVTFEWLFLLYFNTYTIRINKQFNLSHEGRRKRADKSSLRKALRWHSSQLDCSPPSCNKKRSNCNCASCIQVAFTSKKGMGILKMLKSDQHHTARKARKWGEKMQQT